MNFSFSLGKILRSSGWRFRPRGIRPPSQLQHCPLPSSSFRLEPLPGYAPTIRRLVGILLYTRQTTLAAVEGLSIAELDHLQDDSSNSTRTPLGGNQSPRPHQRLQPSAAGGMM